MKTRSFLTEGSPLTKTSTHLDDAMVVDVEEVVEEVVVTKVVDVDVPVLKVVVVEELVVIDVVVEPVVVVVTIVVVVVELEMVVVVA